MSHVFDVKKWGVHVCGPDNVLAASSFQQAVEKANEINQAMIDGNDALKKITDKEDPVLCFAKVSLWDDIASFEHNPCETKWEYATA